MSTPSALLRWLPVASLLAISVGAGLLVWGLHGAGPLWATRLGGAIIGLSFVLDLIVRWKTPA